MPKYLPATQEEKDLQYLAVLRRVMLEPGMTFEVACKEASINPASLREFRARNPAVLQAFQQIMTEGQYEMMEMLLTGRVKVLKKLIEDGLSDDIRAGERVMVWKAVEEAFDRLSEDVRLDGGNADAAADVLGGPVLKMANSRFSIEQTTTRITVESDKTPEEPPDLLEGSWSDDSRDEH